MINIKFSAVVSGAAFVLSLGIGLLSGAGFFALARALILGAAFFLLSVCAYGLVFKFMPELLSPLPELELGGQVDISLGEEGPGAFEKGLELPEGEERAPPEDAGIDQFLPIEYTDDGGGDEKPAKEPLAAEGASTENLPFENSPYERAPHERAPQPVPRGRPALPEDSFNAVDELPDMDMLASAFVSSGMGESRGSEQTLSLDIAPGDARGLRRRASTLDRDYSTDDMASAVQTILRRD